MVKHFYKKNETIGLLVPIETGKQNLNAAEQFTLWPDPTIKVADAELYLDFSSMIHLLTNN